LDGAGMKFNDLIEMYEDRKKQYGDRAYLYVSEIFEEAREHYRSEYLSSPRAARLRAQGRMPDAEQSWKPFKGANFEKLVLYIIKQELESMGLRCISGDKLLRPKNLPAELSDVYRKLVIRYGQYSILPDADLVIYEPKSHEVIGIVSCKTTLRERIAQTAYWKLKLSQDPVTMHIKGYFITADEDRDLVRGLSNAKVSRNRIIVEHELDGTYVFHDVEESEKVKPFPKFIEDLRKIVNQGERRG
jgi:type II restriction enzyme